MLDSESVVSNESEVRAAAGRTRSAMAERVRELRLEKHELIRQPRRRRPGWLTIVVLLLAVLSVAGYRRGWKLPTGPAAPEMETLVVARERPLEILLDTTGYLAAEHVVKVNPRVPGMVTELKIEEGQRVRKGDLLARLDDGQFRADLDQARAALAAAQAALAEAKLGSREEEVGRARAVLTQAEAHEELARSQLQRAETLRTTISPAELERAQAAAHEARAAVLQAREGLKLLERGPRQERIAALVAEADRAKALVAKAEYFFEGTEIRAPQDGIVLQKSAELGESLRAEALAGNGFCTLADLGQLQAEIDIQERDLAAIRVGQPCLVIPEAYPDHEYLGRLEWMSPIYNRQRGVRRVKIDILKPDELLAPDMNCRVQILSREPGTDSAKVVRVPVDAVQGEGPTQFVWLYDDGVARRRDVRLGESAEGKVEIREGLAGGETLLLPGQQALTDGQSVRVRDKSPTTRKIRPPHS
jgi:HlyD family secretion protein